MKINNNKVIYMTFMPFGCVMIIFSLFILKKNLALVHSGQKTSATVIQLLKSLSKHKAHYDTSFTPVYEFTTLSNKKEHYISKVSSYPSSWTVGDTATIVYDINDTKNAIIFSFWGIYGGTVFVSGFGSIFLIIGAVCLYLTRRSRR